MASSSSWWLKSLLSPAKNWFSSHHLNRLRNYAFRFRGKVLESSVEEESLSDGLRKVEKIIGYSFNNKVLLQQAFTHQSFHSCVSYERLEYVGDSILNLLITKQQFFMYPNLPPGSLTALRAANVDTEKLARVAVKHNFHKYLRHKKPLLGKQIRLFIRALQEYPLHSHGLIDTPKILADIVESTIGAVFIDSNSSVDTTWEVTKVLLEPIITPEMLQTNPVRKLNEVCQKHKLKVRFVDRWTSEGAYEIFVDDKLRGRGEYQAKKEVALNRAAENAYNSIMSSMDVNCNVGDMSHE